MRKPYHWGKKKFLWLALFAAAVLAGILLWMQAESTGIFYRVSGGKNELYLLGSIHVGSREMYPMSREIREALRAADVLAFECDTSGDDSALITKQLMNYETEDSLENHISAKNMEKLDQAADRLGYDIEALKRLKPWAVVSLLSMDTLSAQMGEISVQDASALGVENQVRRLAKGRETVYLETVQEQLQRLDAFSPALQEYLLDDACQSILSPQEAEDEELQSWPAWWAAGNASAFADSYRRGRDNEEQPKLAQEYHDSLITQRNRSMALSLSELLESDETGSCFATIGLMHLVLEEDSILTELKNMGYSVEKIEN